MSPLMSFSFDILFPATQFAALSGLKIITTCSPKHFAYVKSLGATIVIDRSSETLSSDIIAAAGGKVSYVVDAISQPDTEALALDILAPKGKLILVYPPEDKVFADAEKRDMKVVVILGISYRWPNFLFVAFFTSYTIFADWLAILQ